MFREWLKENRVEEIDFSAPLFPKASDRAFWKSRYDEEEVKYAEKFLNFEWPIIRASDFLAFNTEGNRLKQEEPHFLRRKALIGLILGEVLEYKGRFLPDIVDGIFAICEESFWGISAHKAPYVHRGKELPDVRYPLIDLFAAETGSMIAIAYYLLNDELKKFCPDILVRIEHEVERRIIKPYMEHIEFWWMGYYQRVNNWNPWILSNVLTALLLVEERKTVRTEGIKKLLYEINNIYDFFPADGGCEEGAQYWFESVGCLLEFCDQLYISTNGRVNFFKDEKIRNIARYIYIAYIGNGYMVNYGDCTTKMKCTRNYIFYMCGKHMADDTFNGLMGDLLKTKDVNAAREKRTGNFRRILFTLINSKEMKDFPDFIPQETCVLNDLQNSYVRNADWYYSAKGGDNDQMHNHNDVGSFIVYYKNMPLLIDPGVGIYTKKTFSPQRYEIWTMQSGWHNLPVVNGTEQPQGKQFSASEFKLNGKTTEIEFSKAYEQTAELQELRRKISMCEDGVEIRDSFKFKKDQNIVAETFITVRDVCIKGKSVIIDGRFVLETGRTCKISIESMDFSDDSKLVDMWQKEKITRLKFEFEINKNAELSFLVKTLQAD